MSVTRATPNDIPHIVALGEKNFRAMGNLGAFDPITAAQSLENLFNNAGAAFISRRGMIGGMIAPYWAAPTNVQAIELFWYSEDGKGAHLLGAFERWAIRMGATEITIAHPNLNHGGLQRRGYRASEAIYRRAL